MVCISCKKALLRLQLPPKSLPFLPFFRFSAFLISVILHAVLIALSEDVPGGFDHVGLVGTDPLQALHRPTMLCIAWIFAGASKSAYDGLSV